MVWWERKLVLLAMRQARKSSGEVLGLGKRLDLESQQTEEMAGCCPKEPSPLGYGLSFSSIRKRGKREEVGVKR